MMQIEIILIAGQKVGSSFCQRSLSKDLSFIELLLRTQYLHSESPPLSKGEGTQILEISRRGELIKIWDVGNQKGGVDFQK